MTEVLPISTLDILVQLEQKLEQQSAVLVKLADRADQASSETVQLREQLAALQGLQLDSAIHHHCCRVGLFAAHFWVDQALKWTIQGQAPSSGL